MEQILFTSKTNIKHRKETQKPDPFEFPEKCILGFFPTLYRYIEQKYTVQKVDFINKRYPYFLFSRNGIQLAFLCPGMGAPLAGAQLDETIALGAEIIIFFGPCGVIDSGVSLDSVILLNGAVSDEGTSRHYPISSKIIQPDVQLSASLEANFISHGIPVITGRTWTTDAPYRETLNKIQSMRQKGCVCVDMESSALLTIARFYKKKIAGFLIPGDRMINDNWEPFMPQARKSYLKSSHLLERALEATSQWVI